MVMGNSPIREVKDLDDKPVAIHAKGSISYVMLQAIAKAKRIKPVVLEIPAPTQFVALSRGDIAAAMAQTPFAEQMLVAGGRSIFSLPDASVIPYMAATVTLTTAKYANEHPRNVEKILAVEMRTARWAMDNPTKARDLISGRLNYKAEVIEAINPSCYKFGRNGLFLMSSIQWWGRTMRELGMIQSEPDYGRYFITSHAENAAKTIGYAPDPDFDALQKIPLN
jgi:ABC-type nitrate/sulfonate/bicarbonate transport system substrate-binding protein